MRQDRIRMEEPNHHRKMSPLVVRCRPHYSILPSEAILAYSFVSCYSFIFFFEQLSPFDLEVGRKVDKKALFGDEDDMVVGELLQQEIVEIVDL